MELTDTQIAAFLQQYFLPFVRIGALLMVMPVVGSRIVSPRVRLVLAFLVALISVPLLPPMPPVKLLSFESLGYVVQEAAIGLLLGFVFQVVFQMFVLAGQYMAMKMGLGFAQMNDPTNGVQTTVISQFFLMLTTLMFVAVEGHVMIIAMVVESFQVLKPGTFFLKPEMFWFLASMGSWLFSSALVFALPVLTSLLFINVAFGIMSRAAPQLNIFAVGFPFTLTSGLLLIWLGLSNFPEAFNNTMSYGFSQLSDIIRL